ncbi:hypothetical protein D7234_11890 [Legionella pneumophila]|uniref:Uncharacterized protein n=1 Tax=Legionella pneumophila TaxID=446 RepID=A0A2S6F5Q0_LEGPN|nr:hypothetical protein PtVF66_03450 [Legionella pneumophila]KXB28726.1 hypothetical protein PtVF89_00385 [Legionella pneumophila]PPK32752.1 hypothetical protein C3928_02675 [Legionella pneumophila]RYW25215.1 hypothetical protein D7234_11890 [Legionella pneumophila]
MRIYEKILKSINYSIFFNFRVGCVVLLPHQKVLVKREKWKWGKSIQIESLIVQEIRYPRSNRSVMAIR